MPPKVLIAGAGLSGLALAQCLRRQKVEFELFERDANNASRQQGWAITLREALAGLEQLFPDDMPPLEDSVNVFRNLEDDVLSSAGISAHQLRSFSAVNYATGEVTETISAAGKGDVARHWIRANRAVFREWLSFNLDIQWGKNLVRYEETPNGVRAFFADGSSAAGDILIGADGAHSRCRAQLMGPDQAKCTQATAGVITANIGLEMSDYLDVLRMGAQFVVATSPSYHFFMGPRDFSDDSKVGEYYWSVTWDVKATAGSDEWTPAMDAQSSREYALRLCKELHPSLRTHMEKTTASQMASSSPQLLEWKPDLDRLPGSRVTTMGDALHTMVPFRGAGANTALLDAFDLAQLITECTRKQRDLMSVIAPYEQLSIPRGRKMVEFSSAASLSPDTTLWGRISKRVFEAGFEWKRLDDIL